MPNLYHHRIAVLACYRPNQGLLQLTAFAAQCATYYHHLIFATAWNISADLMLIAVPLKLLPGLQLPLKKKILIIGVLSLGVFNVSSDFPPNPAQLFAGTLILQKRSSQRSSTATTISHIPIAPSTSNGTLAKSAPPSTSSIYPHVGHYYARSSPSRLAPIHQAGTSVRLGTPRTVCAQTSAAGHGIFSLCPSRRRARRILR